MLEMSVNKISSFLYIKIFIVCIGFLNSYLILEWLIVFTYDLTCFGYILSHDQNYKYKICPFQYFFGSILKILVEMYACLCLHIIYCIFITTFHTLRSHITTWTAQTRPKLQVQKMSFLVFLR